VFVPPNDPRSDKQKSAKGVLPAFRTRQRRCFPATRPDESTLQLVWNEEADDPRWVQALQRLAQDTAYVGHSASLTRCRFLTADSDDALDDAVMPTRSVYPGRFDELCRAFEAHRRPQPGAWVREAPPPARARIRSVFDQQWLLLEHIGDRMPDVRACALIAKTIRDALLSGYRQLDREHEIPEVVSGHAAGGSPTRLPHLAMIPMPFVGSAHAEGQIMGFAVVPPLDVPILQDELFRKVLRTLAPLEERWGRRVLTLKSKEGSARDQAFCIRLSPTFEPPIGTWSLDPSLYQGPRRSWASVTPIVLDRHLKTIGAARQDELAAQIAAACRNIGLPEPRRVVASKHSALKGAVSAYPSGGEPAWMRWRLPGSLATRQLTHAVLEFSEAIEGPVILGGGRFVGLGLCRPIGPKET
jgi:CRISPR-associated protein Csb2